MHRIIESDDDQNSLRNTLRHSESGPPEVQHHSKILFQKATPHGQKVE
jgi:hypothetical protein